MYIDKEKCSRCGMCIPYCPVRAIAYTEDKSKVEIDQDRCVECEVCKYSKVCAKDAMVMPELEWPRLLRGQFSNPLASHPGTGVPGRGTEEMKTNDVTDRFKRGHAGMAIEMGRPGISTRFSDVQKMAEAVAKQGVQFETHNPVTPLIVDKETGKMKEDILNERVLSAIIEFDVPYEKIISVLDSIRSASEEIDTVFSLDLICRLEEDGSNPVAELVREAGFTPSLNGKTNVGIGKCVLKEVK